LAALPGDIDAVLHNRLGLDEYDTALRLMDAMSSALRDLGSTWHRPHSGQPSLEIQSYAMELLVGAIEDVMGKALPSPRSPKRPVEIELVQLLACLLFPTATLKNVRTMLNHFHNRRLKEGRAARRKV
jgi:hypothetical protein